MNGKTLSMMAVLTCCLITGCSGTYVQTDLRGFPSPVMVSPIVRIGDTAPPNVTLPEFGRFRGESSFAGGGGGGSHREGNYIVYESRSVSESSDSIGYEISKTMGGRTDLLVLVDTLCAGSVAHTSLMGYFNNWVCLEGRVLDPKPLQGR